MEKTTAATTTIVNVKPRIKDIVKSSTGDDKIVKKPYQIFIVHIIYSLGVFIIAVVVVCFFFVCSFEINIHMNCVCSSCKTIEPKQAE